MLDMEGKAAFLCGIAEVKDFSCASDGVVEWIQLGRIQLSQIRRYPSQRDYVFLDSSFIIKDASTQEPLVPGLFFPLSDFRNSP